MSVWNRTPIEEQMLTPAPLKLIVFLLTTIYDNLLVKTNLETTIFIILLLVGTMLILLSLYLSLAKLKILGFFIISLGVFVLLNPSASVKERELPVFSFDNPPTLPKIGQILRGEVTVKDRSGYFKDSLGRVVLLRGVNFGASTKIPSSNAATHIKGSNYYDARNVSFVGRPCPLEEADEHFKRLSAWGFNFLRLLITWEAVEHDGPKQYDFEYLEYLKQLCQKANKYGLSVFIDPHQDVWSRWTGGDGKFNNICQNKETYQMRLTGAPGWTLEKVGFKIDSTLFETGATLSHQEFGDPFPRMVWATNYAKLACGTMFTLFFAGNEYAPKTMVDNMSAQDYLQYHYIEAMKQVAIYLKDEKNVLGFDTLNEPSNGFVGLADVRESIFPVPTGFHMSVYDGMILGAGFSREIDSYTKGPFIFTERFKMNPNKKTCWQSPEKDVWRQNGVWDIDSQTGTPKLLRPAYFKSDASFLDVHMVPFFLKFTNEIRSVVPDMVIFAEPHINPRKLEIAHAPRKEFDSYKVSQFSWAPHFYDVATLMTKSYRDWYAIDVETEFFAIGKFFVNRVFQRTAKTLKSTGNGFPVIIGEVGVPMDFSKELFKKNDFSSQSLALDRVLSPFEQHFLSWTIWTYTPDNTNERGDLWNGEDLSLYSKDQVRNKLDVNSGGRTLHVAVRPYPIRLAGEPLETLFEPFSENRNYFLKVRLLKSKDSSVSETLLFIPKIQYPNGITWKIQGEGSLKAIENPNEQGFIWTHDLQNMQDGAVVEQSIAIEAKN